VCRAIAASAPRLQHTSAALARLDVVAALSETAVERGYVRPTVVEDDVLQIVGGRHPVVEPFLTRQRFVPNDAVLEAGERIRVITGPNMSGKSTYLRQVALLCLMAQIGSFIPAASARIGLVDRIFTRIGAQDEIHSGQSTFMVEMIEAANILHHATRRSLLIFDEVAGTRPRQIYRLGGHQTSITISLQHLLPPTTTNPPVGGISCGERTTTAVVEQGKKAVFYSESSGGQTDRTASTQLAGLPRPIIDRARIPASSKGQQQSQKRGRNCW
jgi:DNA mismatch repair protein MutS